MTGGCRRAGTGSATGSRTKMIRCLAGDKVPRRTAAIVLAKSEGRLADAAAVVHAFNAGGFRFGAGQGGKQHARKDSDDRDHDQQFNEGEAFLVFLHISSLHFWVGLCAFSLELLVPAPASAI